MASMNVEAAETRSTRRSVREAMRWTRVLSLALHLALPAATRAGDYYYPEYKRNPVPPVVVVDDLAVQDEPVAPACNPANEGCDDPAPASTALASRDEGVTGVHSRRHPAAPSLPKGLKLVPSS